ncbi:histidine kinase [Streptomyces sp. NPDC050610]|uniref:sensor histidine kinase n=1 Tax=Streptomyces sp. NPDC050610 TaxID=3157097 RepID=UPI00341BB22F
MTATGEAAGMGVRGAPTGPWWWARRRSLVLDVCLALASVLECVAEGARFSHEASLPLAFGVLVGVLAGSVMLLRRRWPAAAVLVSIAVTPAQMGFLLGVVALYTLAASDVPRRIIAVLAGMSVVGSLIVVFVRFDRDMAQDGYTPGTWLIVALSVLVALGLTAPPVLLGMYVGARRRLVESLRERADGLERELSLLADRAEERAEWARSEERTRIAREMHDVVAHRVSLMVVHAAALQAVAVKDPEKASKNAALVGDMGRQALTELREMLGVLRRTPEGQVAEKPSAAGPTRLAAAVAVASGGPVEAEASAGAVAGVTLVTAEGADGPGLADLEVLVGQSRAAGMVVELLAEGAERPYAGPVEQTAYRVVQEALTNVHKHAPGAKTRVRLAHREAEVALQVENGPSDGADVRLPSGGNGLVGMRERVSALGGVFVSGPTDAGGFRVSAVIPDAAP